MIVLQARVGGLLVTKRFQNGRKLANYCFKKRRGLLYRPKGRLPSEPFEMPDKKEMKKIRE